MTWVLRLATVFGCALLVGLVLWFGVGDVAEAFASAGWGVALVVLARAAALVVIGYAWARLALDGEPRTRVFVALRVVREGVNNLLPVAQVGGDLIAARLLTFQGMSGGAAGACILVDMFAQVATQFLFTLVGLGVLMRNGGDEATVAVVSAGLAVTAPALIGFFAAQRYGGFRLIERGMLRLARDPRWARLGGIADLHHELQRIWRAPRALAACFALHFATWFFGAIEVQIALGFMGHPIAYADALVIEALGQAVRGAAFLVPGAIGIQEGGFVALCALYGVPADSAIALSLVKRVPDLLLGLPGIMLWQAWEGRRWRGGSAAPKRP
jgi:putative membrane protein